ncbi:MAG: formylglycine-generating enzyme family protein [Fibrobacter sp.]|nr:formylglycine-generating enzyme family protein [Fibrobacter sp.]
MKKVFSLIGFLISVTIASTELFLYDAKGNLVKKENVKDSPSIFSVDVRKKYGPLYVKKHNVSHMKSGLLRNPDVSFFISESDLKHKDYWIEVEKNQSFLTCFEKNNYGGVVSKLDGRLVNDSCAQMQAPDLVGSSEISVLDMNGTERFRVYVSIGMKYLDLSKSIHKLGFYGDDYDLRINSIFNDSIQNMKNRIYPDPERLVVSKERFLVDTYLVTNCEIVSVLSKNISMNPQISNLQRQLISEKWADRKRKMQGCFMNDTAANTLTLYQAMLYANQRSLNDGFKPYYKFENVLERENTLLPDGRYVISLLDFKASSESCVLVSVDESSDGYRLPYYDEWMIFARGGGVEDRSVWGDDQSLENAQTYAWLGDESDYELHTSMPVGLLKPNKFGLYDVFGLAGEFVLFKDHNPFKRLQNTPSCLKGGNYKTRIVDSPYGIYVFPYWKSLNYGYFEANYGASIGGVRLVRKLKN